MASETIVVNQDNFLHVDYDKSKLLIQYGKFSKETFDNNTGAQADFAVGLVLGKEGDTNRVVPLDVSKATKGEHNVFGILYQPLTAIAIDGTQADVAVLVEGDVDASKVILEADTLATPIAAAGITIQADLQRVGIRLIDVDELYSLDN